MGSRFGDYPRLMFLIAGASVLCIIMHTEENAKRMLTPKQVGVIEGCCNFMEYLKGAGTKTLLVDGNPCVSFRENYEAPMGIPVVVNATEAAQADADAAFMQLKTLLGQH